MARVKSEVGYHEVEVSEAEAYPEYPERPYEEARKE